jgi:hypothetical protein
LLIYCIWWQVNIMLSFSLLDIIHISSLNIF